MFKYPNTSALLLLPRLHVLELVPNNSCLITLNTKTKCWIHLSIPLTDVRSSLC